MEEYTPEEIIQIGKTNLKLVLAAIGTVMLLNIALSAFYWISWVALALQIISFGLVIALSILILKGYRIRWYLISFLLITAFSFFFNGGQRMIFEQSDGGFASLASVGSGLALIGAGIYLGANAEIMAYLQSIAPAGEREE